MIQKEMKVEELKNYGKNVLEISASSASAGKKLKIAKAAGKFFLKALWYMGIRGTVSLLKNFKKDMAEAKSLDWSDVLAKGISQKNLDSIIKKFVVNKGIASRIGRDRLQTLRFEFSSVASYDVMEEMFASAATFMACGNGDFLPPFRKYFLAMMDRMAESGIESYVVETDEKDVFKLNVTYCAYYEVAKKLSDPYLCYITSCHGDEVFFERFCGEAGFTYAREGTLATGKRVCDECFTRKKA